MPNVSDRRPRGRRPGQTQTRQAILVAARAQFARYGWEGATIRAIARDADVDPSLVLHFFGSKEVLFTAATSWPFDPEVIVEHVVTGPRSGLGRRLAGFFLEVWEDPVRREPIMAMLRAATTNEQAARQLRETVMMVVLAPLAERLDVPDADLRISLCGAHVVGLGMARYIVGIEPLASLDAQRVAELVAPAFQHYLTGRL